MRARREDLHSRPGPPGWDHRDSVALVCVDRLGFPRRAWEALGRGYSVRGWSECVGGGAGVSGGGGGSESGGGGSVWGAGAGSLAAPGRDPELLLCAERSGFWRLGRVTGQPGAPHALSPTPPRLSLLRPRAPPTAPATAEGGPWAACPGRPEPRRLCSCARPRPHRWTGGTGQAWAGVDRARSWPHRRPCAGSAPGPAFCSPSTHRVPAGQARPEVRGPASFLHSLASARPLPGSQSCPAFPELAG